jgi:hypothetical protein
MFLNIVTVLYEWMQIESAILQLMTYVFMSKVIDAIKFFKFVFLTS